MSTFVSIIGVLACFFFGAGHAASAAKAFEEKKWGEFGFCAVLSQCFVLGICIIFQMWAGN